MSAKHKLNSAFINGALIVAAVLGAMFESWTVFFVAAGVLLATSLHDGSIR